MPNRFTIATNLTVCLWSALFLLLPCIAFAQITNVTDDQNTPVPGSGHNYIGMMNETVSPANGSVSFRLSVPMPPGRGLTLPLSIAYDSNGASHVVAGANGSAQWMSNTGFGDGGWSNTLPMLSWTYGTYTQNESGTIYSCDYVADFVFQDANGGRHFFPMIGIVDSYQQCSYTSLGQNSSILYGGDDLYIAVATSFLFSGTGTVQVTDLTAGLAYSFNVSDTGQYTTASFVEDRNGNRVSYGQTGSYNWGVTDTLGRAAATLSTTSPGYSSTISVSGLSDPYTLYWATPRATSPYDPQTAAFSDGYCLQSPIPNYYQTTEVVTSIDLPNGQSYQFSYDSTYGLLSQITYPTGAWVKYTWGWNTYADYIAISDYLGNPGGCGYYYSVPAVTERQVSFDGSTTALTQYFSYSTNWTGNTWKTTTVQTVDNKTGATTVAIYKYTGVLTPNGAAPGENNGAFTQYVPVESSVTYQDGSNTKYRVENETWSDQFLMTCKSTTDYFNGSAGATTRTQWSTGAIWPLSNVSVWDWSQALPPCGQSAGTTPIRQTNYTSQSFPSQVYPTSDWNTPLPTYYVPHFYLPTSVTTLYNGTQVAETTLAYDGSSLTTAGISVGRDSQFNGSSITSRGNVTSKTQWLSGGTSPVTSYTYDDTGQRLTMTDPCGNTSCSDMTGSNHTTSYSYADYDAYVSEISYPTTANGVAHSVSFTYNFADGQLATSADQNNQTTHYYYGQNGELLDRLTSISYPDGGSTTYSYGGICPATQSSSLISGSLSYTETITMDGLCHVTATAVTSDPQGTDYTATAYDGHGRTWQVSNPYRSTSDSSYGITTTTYDPLGRVISVAAPDGSTTTTSYSTANNQECSLITDPAGVSRNLCSDALGRLRQVTEVGLGTTTSYSYDGLDDLLTVSQGGQSRSFGYDSLKHLLSASDPEASVSGTQCATTYTYDLNGNISSKVAPLENQNSSCSQTVTTTFSYDVLNRVSSKSYSDGTPTAAFAYDESTVTVGSWTSPSLAYPKGRLTHTTTANGSTILTATAQDYDPMGRPQHYWQCTPLNCGSSSIWGMTYGYDAAGDVTSWTHPAGFTITQTIDGAKEITQITSSLSDSTHPAALAQNMLYNAAGAVTSLQNGCVGSGCKNIQETYAYNNRLQMAMAELGTSGSPAADSCRVYNYYPGSSNPTSCAMPSQGSNNNGNVAGYYYTDPMNSGALSHTATYKYTDGVNRLNQASATGNVAYNETFSYDPFGNGTCSASPSAPQCVATTYKTDYSNHINYTSVNGVNTYYTYDAAGNLINDGTNTYYWDAEAHLTKVTNGLGTVSTNTYNALGQRVRDVTATSTTDEAYGAGGNLLWRYTGNSSDPNQRAFVTFEGGNLAEYYGGSPGGTVFDHPDEIGSATTANDYTGNNFQERLYFPFGEFWTGAGSLGMHQTFAKLPDYDPETDEYNTANRHYTPSGRWMSPDPLGGHLEDPQTLNKYAYVRNNPTTLTDPAGLDFWATWGGDACSSDAVTCDNAVHISGPKGLAILVNSNNPFNVLNGFGDPLDDMMSAQQWLAQQPKPAPKPHIPKRDKAYLDKYYKPMKAKAKEYGVDPALPLGIGIESGFATSPLYRRTGDAFGLTGGGKHITHVGSPEEDVDELFRDFGEQMRGTGSNISLFLNNLEMEDATGRQVTTQGLYNSVQIPPTAWKNFIIGGIREMQSDIPMYLSQ